MTRVNFFSVLLIISAIMFLPFTTKAQVTIGGTSDPQSFSILELISNDTRGFRLPQLTTFQRDSVLMQSFAFQAQRDSLAMGLTIFNTCNRCVETWNGREWISLCDGDEPPVIINCDGRSIRVPRFAHFNLGGEVFLTARAQMEHAARLTGTITETSHGSLFGGRFQWGRANIAHAISRDGYFTLWHGSGTTNNAILRGNVSGFNPDTGQPLGAADSLFINDSRNWFTQSEPPLNSLWGNGFAFSEPTNSGVPGVGNQNHLFFQSTEWAIPENDPCRHMPIPGNWRLPTQDEWERIAAYDCNPAIVHEYHWQGGRPPFDYWVVLANSPFKWVRVSCRDNGQCNPVVAGYWTTATRNGFVLYLRSVVYDFEFTAETDLLADDSPEPFLFLPATGWRDSGGGIVRSAGMSGVYWSSTVWNNDQAIDSWFGDSTGSLGIGAGGEGRVPRADGRSVRCVRD